MNRRRDCTILCIDSRFLFVFNSFASQANSTSVLHHASGKAVWCYSVTTEWRAVCDRVLSTDLLSPFSDAPNFVFTSQILVNQKSALGEGVCLLASAHYRMNVPIVTLPHILLRPFGVA